MSLYDLMFGLLVASCGLLAIVFLLVLVAGSTIATLSTKYPRPAVLGLQLFGYANWILLGVCIAMLIAGIGMFLLAHDRAVGLTALFPVGFSILFAFGVSTIVGFYERLFKKNLDQLRAAASPAETVAEEPTAS